jgi:hypothetical protein
MAQVNELPKEGEEIELKEIEVKNVLVRGKEPETLRVKVVPFDRYNDKHVEFAYAYSDMLYRAPSVFKNVSDVSRGYVQIFVSHTDADAKEAGTAFSKVANDLRSCRTLFNQDDIMSALSDFFENA